MKFYVYTFIRYTKYTLQKIESRDEALFWNIKQPSFITSSVAGRIGHKGISSQMEEKRRAATQANQEENIESFQLRYILLPSSGRTKMNLFP